MKIKYYLIASLLFLFWAESTQAQNKKRSYDHYYDGPYVFFQEDTTQVYWINAGQLLDTSYTAAHADSIDLSFILKDSIAYQNLITQDIPLDHQTVYNDVEHVVAISDIHGQYELMLTLLKENKVITNDGHWNFGEGHMVIVGDIFDRGEYVLDILWFMIRLEQEAAAAGGKVHVMLGNHEVMVLQKDIRYVHKKYRYTSALFRTPYSELFEGDSFLGRWVRSKPIYLKINDVSFVHGGISEDFFNYDVDLEDLNSTYHQLIFGKVDPEEPETPFESFLLYDNGPLWYRGYAFKDEYDLKRTTKLLKKLDSEHIVVGHTSMPNIISMFDNRIIFVDSSIKLGDTGEILFIKNGKFISADQNGLTKTL